MSEISRHWRVREQRYTLGQGTECPECGRVFSTLRRTCPNCKLELILFIPRRYSIRIQVPVVERVEN